MNVVILHCHFRRGGVTQVVENHVAALSNVIDGQIVLVSGGRNDGLSQQTLRQTEQLIIEGFDYDALNPMDPSGKEVALVDRAQGIRNRITDGLESIGCGSHNTVLHWHNHSLGKNVAAPLVIRTLSERDGFRQLLQIHDFAEDFRPENYLRLILAASSASESCHPDDFRDDSDQTACSPDAVNRFCYPNSSLIHYATLTSGDASVLSRLGIDAMRVHRLPNSVTLGDTDLPDRSESLHKIRQSASLPPDARWCVYPVRGIRRKNVGELLLLSRFLPAPTFAGLTLPPTTKIESQSYERWRSIGAELAPKVVFDAGTFEGVSFHENLAAADFILSTSAAEGFGMAFLEPWLAGRGVVARRLHNVVDDFTDSGVILDRFYDSVAIPGEPEWLADCRSESEWAFADAWSQIDQECGNAFQVRQTAQEQESGSVDFATLTPRRQIEVLRRIAHDRGYEDAVRELNAPLVAWLAEPFPPSTLEANKKTIATKYSLRISGDRLMTLYRGLAAIDRQDGPENKPLNKDVSVVDMISGERTFFPCRTELEIVH